LTRTRPVLVLAEAEPPMKADAAVMEAVVDLNFVQAVEVVVVEPMVGHVNPAIAQKKLKPQLELVVVM